MPDTTEDRLPTLIRAALNMYGSKTLRTQVTLLAKVLMTTDVDFLFMAAFE